MRLFGVPSDSEATHSRHAPPHTGGEPIRAGVAQVRHAETGAGDSDAQRRESGFDALAAIACILLLGNFIT